jgi:uncharacterized protein (DUF2249 family)
MVLDVRTLPHGKRPSTVFELFDLLEVGACFDLLNDHDPMPLSLHFERLRPGTFRWEYLESGPEVWRVRIHRTAPKREGEPDVSGTGCAACGH